MLRIAIFQYQACLVALNARINMPIQRIRQSLFFCALTYATSKTLFASNMAGSSRDNRVVRALYLLPFSY